MMKTMRTATLPRTARAALDRLLDPLACRLTPAAARLLVEFRPDPDSIKRIGELAEKSNEGELTEQEPLEYAGLISGGDLIHVPQCKARRILKTR